MTQSKNDKGVRRTAPSSAVLLMALLHQGLGMHNLGKEVKK